MNKNFTLCRWGDIGVAPNARC